MTIEECINILAYNRNMCMFNPNTGENKPMNKDCEELAHALDIAIPILKCQIPIPPKVRMVDSDGYWAEFSCPKCGEIVGEGRNCKCGQVLIWD